MSEEREGDQCIWTPSPGPGTWIPGDTACSIVGLQSLTQSLVFYNTVVAGFQSKRDLCERLAIESLIAPGLSFPRSRQTSDRTMSSIQHDN